MNIPSRRLGIAALIVVMASGLTACGNAQSPVGVYAPMTAAAPAHYYPSDPPACEQPERYLGTPKANFWSRIGNESDLLVSVANNIAGRYWCGEITDQTLLEVARAIPQLFPGVCDGLARARGKTGEYQQLPSTDTARKAHLDAQDYLFQQTKGPSASAANARMQGATEFTYDAAGYFCPLSPTGK